MEAGGGGGRRLAVGRVEASPERGRPTTYASAGRPAPARPMRKVQIIYYLCRNGQLEHPHFMELTQHPHQPLRLKDVMDRLTLLRGKGMPALFSWSCKRNYKNGYVWNDLSENDVIYPSDGVEYVLKGSEIFPGCSSDRFQHLRVTDRSPTKPALALPHMSQQSHKQSYSVDGYRDDAAAEDRDDDDELAYSYHHRRTGSSGRLLVAARADKAAAVSARATNRARPVELPVEETSPPSSTSSDKPPVSAPQQQQLPEPVEPSRPGSMLLQLIACGSTAAAAAGGGGGGGGGGSGKCRAEPRRSCGLVSRLSARGGADDEDEDDEDAAAAGADLGRPRFGHLAVENSHKEYFSGSIVESGGGRGTPLPASSLKRSNSYNEERSCSRPVVGAIGEDTMDEQMEGDGGGIRGRCIPGRKKPAPPSQQPQK